MTRIFLVPCAAAVVFGPAAFAADDAFTLSAGVDYSKGDYGTSTSTTITSVPLTARYETGPWGLRLTVPYIEISGATGVVDGLGPVKNTNPKRRGVTSSQTASGLGDVLTDATYNAYYNEQAKLGLDVTGKVKFGTADADTGLGTGQNDYAVQADAYKTFDQVTVFGGVGYNWLGSSTFIPLRNVWNAVVGTSYKIAGNTGLGLSYGYREKPADTAFARSELTGFVNYKLDQHWKAQASLLKGFTNGSPDWGAGVNLAYTF